MNIKKLGLITGLGGVLLSLSLVLGLTSTSGAVAPVVDRTLKVTPDPAKVGQTVTVAPLDAAASCPGDGVDLTYYDPQGTSATYTIPLLVSNETDDLWQHAISFSKAGIYFVDAVCFANQMAPNAATAAGHRSVSGFTGKQTLFTYTGTNFQINAELTAPTNSVLVGHDVTITPNGGGECVGGTVDLVISKPGDSLFGSAFQPTVAPDGTWSLVQSFAAPGGYIVDGTCTVAPMAPASLGHQAAAGQLQQISFRYLPRSITVVAPAVVTPETPAAEPVDVAALNFTG
jgi:hypothetical protein